MFLLNVTSFTMASDSESSSSSLESLDEEEYVGFGLQPYLFEPRAEDYPNIVNVETHEDEFDQVQEPQIVDGALRLQNVNWCNCGLCGPMPTVRESVCCEECPKIKEKIVKFNDSSCDTVECITVHPGFEPVCLNIWVLEAAYHQYKQQYGGLDGPLNERFRYIAYRQLVRWCWGFLGRKNRVVLPACAVHKIREIFPPTFEVKGFSPAMN